MRKRLPRLTSEPIQWAKFQTKLFPARIKDIRNVIKKRWDNFYKNYFHGFIVAVFFLSTVFGVVSFQTFQATSRQLRETQEQKAEIHQQLEQRLQELQKLSEDKSSTQQQLDTKKAELEALDKKYKALEQAKARRGNTVYAAAPAAVLGDWVAQCHAWAKQAGFDLPPAAISLIDKESDCNPNAVNPSSGACGIGQQLACGKWPHAWNDPVGGLIDMKAYVWGRYGSWEAAWSWWLGHHWY